MKGLFVVVVCVLLVSVANGRVTSLTKKNFANEVFGSNGPYIVEFFAPWCGHCKQLKPIYDEVGKKLEGLVGVGAVDCDQEKELCGAFQIKGFPTIKVFGGDRNSKGVKEPTDYQGARSVGAIANAGLALLTDKNIKKVATKEDIDALQAKSVVLLSAKDEPSNLFKALAMQFGDRLAFGFAHGKTATELGKNYGGPKLPALVIGGELFKGKAEPKEIIKAVEKIAGPRKQQQQQQKGGDQQKGGEQKETPAPKPIEYDRTVEEVATQALWESKCTAKPGLCGVAFLDPEDGGEERNNKFVDALKAVLEKVYKNVHIMWMNGPRQSALYDKFRLAGGFPAFAIYQPKIKRVVPYRGSFTADDITEWIEGKVLAGRPASFEVDALPAIKEQEKQ